MAYIVRKAGSNLSESEIMGFVAKQVFFCPTMLRSCFVTNLTVVHSEFCLDCLGIAVQEDTQSRIFRFDPQKSIWQDFEKRT